VAEKVVTLARAYEIAVAELRACYDVNGIVAGRGHYDDYWTRDAFFAWLGALELGDFEVVEQHLRFLASLQRGDGMIPFLVRRYVPWLSHLGVKIGLRAKPGFRVSKALWRSQVIDSNSYFVIGFAEFLKRAGDKEFLREYIPVLESALLWCLKRIKPGESLAWEGPLAGWNDSVIKSGKTLMTNVLFCRAFECWEEICGVYQIALRSEFSGVSAKIREALQREFFNGTYFVDWIDRRGQRYNFFDSNANFLAVLWDVAARSQGEGIIDFALSQPFAGPLLKLVYPPYPQRCVAVSDRIWGIGDLACGEGMYWLEPTCLLALCLIKMKRRDEARVILTGLAELIALYDGAYEVYEWRRSELHPVHRIYRAEHPYARGAALFVLACKRLGCA